MKRVFAFEKTSKPRLGQACPNSKVSEATFGVAPRLKCNTQHDSRALLCLMSFMLSVIFKPFMLSVVMLSVMAPSGSFESYSQDFIFFASYE